MFLLVSPAYGEGPTFTIDEVVQAIKLEIMGSQAIEDGSPKIQISSFSLTLAVVAIKALRGGVDFLVPVTEEGVSRGFSINATHIINISMIVSEKTPITPVASSPGLLPGIQNIKSTLLDAYSGQPVLQTSSLSFTIEFAIVQGDKKNYIFHMIEAGKPEYKNFVTHKLKIQMSVVD
jgi:hypothetical protein